MSRLSARIRNASPGRKARKLLLESLEQRLPFDAALNANLAEFSSDAGSSDLVNPYQSMDDWRDAIVQRQVEFNQQSFGQRNDVYGQFFTWDPDPTDDEAPWLIEKASQNNFIWFCGNSYIEDRVALSADLVVSRNVGTAANFTLAKSSADLSTLSLSSTGSTPVQEAGIDEADIVESDGRYLFVLNQANYYNSELVVVDTLAGSESEVVARFALGDRGSYTHFSSMYLSEGRLTLLGTAFGSYDSPLARAQTVIETLDVSDPASIAMVSLSKIDGLLLDSRMTDGRLYLVTSFQNPVQYAYPNSTLVPTEYSDDIIPASALPEGEQMWPGDVLRRVVNRGYWQMETQQEFTDRIRTQLADAYLPRIVQTNNGSLFVTSQLATPESVFVPAGVDPTSLTLTTVTALDVGGSGDVISSSTLGIDQLSSVYMSASGIYLASTPVNQYYETTTVFRFANPGEPMPLQPAVETQIFSFLIGEYGELSTPAMAKVQGEIRDQFWMDEFQGDLRVVTDSDAGARLYVLRRTGDDFAVIGADETFSAGEQVFSVLFDDAMAYVVTFPAVTETSRYVRPMMDPLFAISLADPTTPTVLGRLEVEGFSDHLIPLDETHLLGIGRNVDPATGADLGAQVAIFDVSEWTQPTLLSRYLLPGGPGVFVNGIQNEWSSYQATVDHHALSWLPEARLFSLPVFNRAFDNNPDSLIPSLGSAQWLLSVDENWQLAFAGSVPFETGRTDRALEANDHIFYISGGEIAISATDDPDNVLGRIELNPFEPPISWPVIDPILIDRLPPVFIDPPVFMEPPVFVEPPVLVDPPATEEIPVAEEPPVTEETSVEPGETVVTIMEEETSEETSIVPTEVPYPVTSETPSGYDEPAVDVPANSQDIPSTAAEPTEPEAETGIEIVTVGPVVVNDTVPDPQEAEDTLPTDGLDIYLRDVIGSSDPASTAGPVVLISDEIALPVAEAETTDVEDDAVPLLADLMFASGVAFEDNVAVDSGSADTVEVFYPDFDRRPLAVTSAAATAVVRQSTAVAVSNEDPPGSESDFIEGDGIID